MNKKCTSCNQVKPIDDFYKRGDIKTKWRSTCKECDAIRRKKWLSKLPPGDERYTLAIGNGEKRRAKRDRIRREQIAERISVCRGIALQLQERGITPLAIEKATGLDRRAVSRLITDKPVRYVEQRTESILANLLIRVKAKEHARRQSIQRSNSSGVGS